jgi:hypothetical protein
MDFIERWFGISPDHGSGATELIWVLAITVIAIGVCWKLSKRFAGRPK